MSEINELLDELKGRYLSWRRSGDAQGEASEFEETIEASPDIEFTPIDPHLSDDALPLRAFSALHPAWIQARCDGETFAQGLQCCLNGRVTRVHALNARMTGTVRGRRYYDQEILLRDGTLLASCSCEQAAPPALSPAEQTAASENGAKTNTPPRTLPCKHIVAVLLAYLRPFTETPLETLRAVDVSRRSPPIPEKMVCPITRQPLDPARPLFQCEHCGMCYSPEGWKFLLKSDKGRCCGCECQNTVKVAASS